MVGVGDEEQIEVLIGLDEGVDHEQGVRGRDVVVHGSMRQEQVALEVLGGLLVGLARVIAGAVRILDQQACPLLGPVVFVDAIIVVAAFSDADLEEVGVVEHGGDGRVASSGVAEDAGVLKVDPGVAFAELLEAGDLVGDGVVAEIGEVGVVKGLGAEGGAFAVDADDDEAEFGEGLEVSVGGGKVAAAAGEAAPAALRTGVDVVDDGVSGVGGEVGGAEEEAVEVGDAVAGLDLDLDGGDPAGGFEAGDVFAGDVDDGLAGGVAKDGDLRLGGGGVGVDEEAVVGGRSDDVVGALGGEELQVDCRRS